MSDSSIHCGPIPIEKSKEISLRVIARKMIELARLYPEAVYSHLDEAGCLYTQGRVLSGPDACGCLVGQAILLCYPELYAALLKQELEYVAGLGTMREEDRICTDSVYDLFVGTDALQGSGLAYLGFFSDDEEDGGVLDWTLEFQGTQDARGTWGEALARANQKFPKAARLLGAKA